MQRAAINTTLGSAGNQYYLGSDGYYYLLPSNAIIYGTAASGGCPAGTGEAPALLPSQPVQQVQPVPNFVPML